ncbi:phosphotransferase family protein [Sphingomonas sp. MMS24-JH45]
MKASAQQPCSRAGGNPGPRTPTFVILRDFGLPPARSTGASNDRHAAPCPSGRGISVAPVGRPRHRRRARAHPRRGEPRDLSLRRRGGRRDAPADPAPRSRRQPDRYRERDRVPRLPVRLGILPVPRAIALERDGAELERPFIVMERIDGGEVASPFAADAYGAHGETLGETFFTALGKLAAHDAAASPLAAHLPLPAADAAWRVQSLLGGRARHRRGRSRPGLVRAAIRRLRPRSPPPPAQKVGIVHGDYRTGNVMHDGKGGMLAMLDWEMAHLGDPLEDLGWALDPIWNHHMPDKVAGMTSRAQAVAWWEAASGMRVDPAAMRCAGGRCSPPSKGRAIWTLSFREFLDGGRVDPVLGLSGWYVARRQDAIIAPAAGGLGMSSPATTSLVDVLVGTGQIAAGAGMLAAEKDPYGGAMLTVTGFLSLLAAQEAEMAAAWRAADIAAMRALMGRESEADDLRLSALDATWAAPSRDLIAHHAAIEAAGGDDAAILAFYRQSTERRELTWPQ